MTYKPNPNKFKDAYLQCIYESFLESAFNADSELYLGGHPRTGAMHRAAFWDGYLGKTVSRRASVRGLRSSNALFGTMSHACLAAGREFAQYMRTFDKVNDYVYRQHLIRLGV
jgi:hypothetical protein